MARQKTAQPRTPKKARHILSTTVREFYEANVIRSRRGHYSVRDGHRISVDPSGRAVLSGTGSDPIEWLVNTASWRALIGKSARPSSSTITPGYAAKMASSLGTVRALISRTPR